MIPKQSLRKLLQHLKAKGKLTSGH
uniref:Uncharacterized protein n=1 Tax=Rhizophora mucronata TaxID=61149 RepID=A0A2P2N7M6_RHIMU